ncbi:helix-turn-helix domain-containing protein [Chitinophaga sp. 22321]|uniref:AraC family transcriptional regulator n=1 Tax=Chitinophaga hostae TaxID=2831022 RepID=A0ABS5J4S0_9BACT|nr:helix-turn-helix transcriptional regulator [Chitinophaga hostae]MBS0030051.1 AraC family transcriptional regulator [Chitinophaga hostae]
MEISNPAEFKHHYLTQNSACDTGVIPEEETTASFLEVTSLETLRSRHKHASFDTTKRNFYTIVFITSGSITETINDSTYTFKSGTLYFIGENQWHSIHQWSNDIKGYHCIFDADYFLLCLKNQVKLNEFPFFQPEAKPFIQLSGPARPQLQQLFEKMSVEYAARKSHNDDLLVRLYLNILFIEAERIHQQQHPKAAAIVPRREKLATGFRKLVAKHYVEYKQVTDYARMLYVNAHYLNDTVKELTGRPASKFIYDQLVLGAKAQLIQTDDPVSEVAATLNFTDQSYFCRFFKKHTGVTPRQFRQQHQHNS